MVFIYQSVWHFSQFMLSKEDRPGINMCPARSLKNDFCETAKQVSNPKNFIVKFGYEGGIIIKMDNAYLLVARSAWHFRDVLLGILYTAYGNSVMHPAMIPPYGAVLVKQIPVIGGVRILPG